ncbi:glycosyltransferase family 2 protein [Rhodopila globiformis]|uniref:glycosyltransferase family 2 protein n=1 Tax=Rhodopila globiformis TaxID=1071 RepID=UPI0013049B04|nr:glycosyltransferase [Rhodopila globiformis]
MHITVITPAYNAAPWLRDCIASVVAQTHRDWSLVVVDDGSADATADIPDNFHDSRISLIRQDHAGVSAARNRGLTAAAGDACLFLDADDRLAPDALARLAAALGAHPAAVAVSGPYARVAADGAIRRMRPSPGGYLLERLLVRNLFANGGHLLIRWAAIEAAGSFRKDLSYGEDWEYWTRLALQGPFATLRRGSAPVLFVRETPEGAYWRMATDPACFAASVDAVYANAAIRQRLGAHRLGALQRRTEAEMAWTIGRELFRHQRRRDGWRWLVRSLRQAPTLKRVVLAGLSWTRAGPFRAYPAG